MPEHAAAHHRIFLALWPDAAARRALAGHASRAALDFRGHAVPPGNLHVTVAFIGGVDATGLRLARRVAADGARAAGPLAVTLAQFGGPGHGGIAWLEGAAAPELVTLRTTLLAGLGAAGLPVDRQPLRPHVTLARRCRLPVVTGPLAVRWLARELALVESVREPDGPRYVTLGRYRLGPRRDPGLAVSGSPAARRRRPASHHRE